MSLPPHRQQRQKRGTVEAATGAKKCAGREAAQQDIPDYMAAPRLMWTELWLEPDMVELNKAAKRRGQIAGNNNGASRL
jgi:hypothetical protein